MNNMRKLMEAVTSNQINEGWDPGAIADAIYAEYNTEGSPLQAAGNNSNEFYRAIIYAYADGTGLFNARAIDGSEIWHSIVSSLEDNFAQHVTADDYKRAEMGEAFGDDPDPYSSVRSARKATMALHDAMDEGMADPRAVADACLRYMSEADVADMAENEGLLYDEWEDDYS